MIKVSYGDNMRQQTLIVEPDKTLTQILQEAGMPYDLQHLHLDGRPLTQGELGIPLGEMVKGSSCYLLNIAKSVDG